MANDQHETSPTLESVQKRYEQLLKQFEGIKEVQVEVARATFRVLRTLILMLTSFTGAFLMLSVWDSAESANWLRHALFIALPILGSFAGYVASKPRR
jgi:hypothetical protein